MLSRIRDHLKVMPPHWQPTPRNARLAKLAITAFGSFAAASHAGSSRLPL